MEGLLKPVTRADKVRGPDNPEHTSCFMNAVLLAMFLPYIPVFDRLFLRGSGNLKRKIQLFVLKARYGLGTFNAERIRETAKFGSGQQDAAQFLDGIWSAVDRSNDYLKTGDISYSSPNTDSLSLADSQQRFLFYHSDIGTVIKSSKAKMASVNIADAPTDAVVKFMDIVLPPQPLLIMEN